MTVRPILEVGDPRLREVSLRVTDLGDPAVRQTCVDLVDTLRDFRARHHWGRAIAAPQIGVPLRILAVELGSGPKILVNPRITWRDPDSFTLWDDCMCFPGLLVKVRRWHGISVHYYRMDGTENELDRLPVDVSELLQHEIDHLDGVLALDIAEGQHSVVRRADFQSDPSGYRMLVEYVSGGIQSGDPGL